ncbi:NAD(P)-dependent oxidoreductase [Natronolimnobius sp. AArcel1]|uniref:NAD-dependent epimerase/dehydratase family protein n=1 Tax=Natronolimnobius sp. AArcel1 TaxID=1679093 RepID=UPI0013ECAA63|nr:NAD(P)-dependent oxidoreductase [Natronolimnobius sp. AArcel1]NGM67942.1 NAD(P)-dependent oxidoreductase [Natronolimnobius sp. AArcel1]
MTIKRVAVTGGNGKIGEAILRELADHSYETVNISRGRRGEDISDAFCSADLLDAGDTYGAIARSDVDAVIHMGTIPGPTEHPGFRTYESNVMSAYHVLEAATELGLESIVLPSSINVMGAAYQDAPTDVRYLPVDEDHPLTPRDPYAMSKHAMEVTADGFGRQPDAPTITSLRYPWVATDDELREEFVEPDRSLEGLEDAWHHTTRAVVFSYIHIDDAASIARHAVEAAFDGHEAFWAVAGDTSAEVDAATLAAEYFPDAEIQSPLEGHEALISTEKARELLGWEPERSWRDL